MQKLAIQILSDKEFSGVVKSNPKYGYVDPDDNLGFADPSEGKVFVRNLHWPELNKWLLTHEIEHILDPSNGTDRDENGIYHKRGLGSLGSIGGAILGNLLMPGIGGALLGGALGGLGGGWASGNTRAMGRQAAGGAIQGGLGYAGGQIGQGLLPGSPTIGNVVGTGIGTAAGSAASGALQGQRGLGTSALTSGLTAGALAGVTRGLQTFGQGGGVSGPGGAATGGGAFPPVPQGTFGGASGLSPVSAGAMGAGAGAGGAGGSGLNAFQLPNTPSTTGYAGLNSNANFLNTMRSGGGGQFGMGSPASPMAGAPSTSLGASSNFSMGGGATGGGAFPPVPQGQFTGAGGGSPTAPMASQVLRTQGMTQPITPQATPGSQSAGLGFNRGAFTEALGQTGSRFAPGPSAQATGQGGAGGGGGGGFHPLQALGRALGIGQEGGQGARQAGQQATQQGSLGTTLGNVGLGLGIGQLGTLLAPQVNATNQNVPDLGQLPSIQNLRSLAGQPISDIAKRATGVLQGRLAQNYSGIPADAQANIQRQFDIERRNQTVQFKQFRPDADLATDSRFREAMQQIDQRQAEAIGQLDLQYRQQFQNVQTQDIQTALGVDTQTLNTLSSLAQYDVATVMTRLGLSAQEAQNFKNAFGQIGGIVAAQGLGVPTQISLNVGGR